MTTASNLYGRVWRITAGTPGANGKQWTDVDCRFRIKRTSSSTPNEIDLTIYNLAADSRALFEKRKTAVIVEAGYGDRLIRLGGGEVLKAGSALQNADWETTIEAADGATSYGQVISETFPPNTTEKQAIETIAKRLGVPVATVKGLDGNNKWSNGRVVSGPARFALDAICKTRRLRWSIQDGALLVLPIGQTAGGEAVLLTRDTGLVGSPEKTDKGWRARSLLQGQISPGRPVKIEARDIKGVFLCEQVEHVGDTMGQDWYSDLILVKVA